MSSLKAKILVIVVIMIILCKIVESGCKAGGEGCHKNSECCTKSCWQWMCEGDQFDNAQRVHEKGFGVRIDSYLCSEEELLNAIEMLLNDNLLNEKLSLISKRMQSSDSLKIACSKIEELQYKS